MKKISTPCLKSASTSRWSFSRWNLTSSRSADTRYLFVSTSCAPTLESTSFLISVVPCWLGVTGTPARWLFKNCCLWDSNNLQVLFQLKIPTREWLPQVTHSIDCYKTEWIRRDQQPKLKPPSALEKLINKSCDSDQINTLSCALHRRWSQVVPCQGFYWCTCYCAYIYGKSYTRWLHHTPINTRKQSCIKLHDQTHQA